MKVLSPPLDRISTVARPYPAWLLNHCETGLCLFSSAFLGHNDAIHFARAELQTTCVDVNNAHLAQMAGLYPDDWDFVCDDAWEFAAASVERGEMWDAVSVDTFLGDATARSLTTLELWCSLARVFVTATIPTGLLAAPPDGFKATIFTRSSQASWLILERQ